MPSRISKCDLYLAHFKFFRFHAMKWVTPIPPMIHFLFCRNQLLRNYYYTKIVHPLHIFKIVCYDYTN